MKLFRSSITALAALGAGLCVLWSQGAAAADTSTNAPSAAKQAEIPQAVFDVTSSPVKDPFFPHTTRLPLVAAHTNVVAAVDASIFILKGMSGTPGHRLALINNRTLEAGESTEVTVPDGRKIRIHCIEINEDSVTIKADSQASPIELRYGERAAALPKKTAAAH